MAEKVYSLEMNAGFKTFELNFADVGDKVQIQFNPADADLSKRMFEAKKMVEDAISKLTEANDAFKGGTEEEQEKAYIEVMDSAEKALCEAVDYAFANKISDKVFKHCSPLALVNGTYFIAQFFEAITPVVQKIKEDEESKADKKAKKIIAKYDKQRAEFGKKIGGA